jgi:hypothetical protein
VFLLFGALARRVVGGWHESGRDATLLPSRARREATRAAGTAVDGAD